MAGKPELPSGYLGAQPRFTEMGMETESHKDGEFKVKENHCRITFKTAQPVKTVAKLVVCSPDREVNGFVLSQRTQEEVHFDVGFPEPGWYKFQLYALEQNDDSEQLPGVFNYLIEVEKCRHPAQPFVKTYTKFYTDFCHVIKPLCLHPHDKHLDKAEFELKVPGAKKVAVHAGEEWFQLEHKGDDKWEGKANLKKYQGKNTKVTINANYDEGGLSYSVLLEYII